MGKSWMIHQSINYMFRSNKQTTCTYHTNNWITVPVLPVLHTLVLYLRDGERASARSRCECVRLVSAYKRATTRRSGRDRFARTNTPPSKRVRGQGIFMSIVCERARVRTVYTWSDQSWRNAFQFSSTRVVSAHVTVFQIAPSRLYLRIAVCLCASYQHIFPASVCRSRWSFAVQSCWTHTVYGTHC